MDNSKIEKISTYHKRYIRFIDLLKVMDWKIKRYWISWQNEYPNFALMEKCNEVIQYRLSSISGKFNHYNVGFSIVHEGKDGVYFIVSHWIEENMLDHLVFVIDNTVANGYKRIDPNSIVSCIWELEVMYHEKRIWKREVLVHKDLNKYLKNTLSVDI